MTSAPPGPKKVAVLGGGIGGLAAAYYLAQAPDHEVTVYEAGAEVGGKLAADLLTTNGGARIQEHGLHMMMGAYENTFRLLKSAYASARDPWTPPNEEWEDSFARYFLPSDKPVGARPREGEWHFQEFPLRRRDGLPGTRANSEIGLSILDAVKYLVSLAVISSVSGDPLALGGRGAYELLDGLMDGNSDGIELPEGVAGLTAFTTGLRAWAASNDLTNSGTGPGPGAATATGRDSWASRLERLEERLVQYRSLMRCLLRPTDSAAPENGRRLWELVDLFSTVVIGLIRAGALPDPNPVPAGPAMAPVAYYFAWLEAVEPLDACGLRAWLRRHGASDDSTDGPIVRALRSAVFCDDATEIGAATFINGAYRIFGTYLGAPFLRMRGSTEHVVAEPIKVALEDIRAGTVRTSHTVTGIDFEHNGTQWLVQRVSFADAAIRPIERGVDFEKVVLAIPPNAWESIQLSFANAPQGDTLEEELRTIRTSLRTTATLALQLWTVHSPNELGWPSALGSSPLVAGFAPPLSVWADMQHLIQEEGYTGTPPTTVGYFCGPVESGLLADRVSEVRDAWIEAHLPELLPELVDSGSIVADELFDFTVFAHAPEDRIKEQFLRYNDEGSSRYVLSVPGSRAQRPRASHPQVENLVFAGDWTRTSWSVGAVEAAVVSGALAAKHLIEDTSHHPDLFLEP